MMSQSVWPNVFVLYAGYRFHWSTLIIGSMLMINGGLGIVVQMLLVGPIVKRIGERGAVLVGATCGVIAMTIAGLANQGWIYMCCIPFAAASNLLQAGLMALMTQRVGPTEQGRLQGANQSLQGVTSVIGPLLYGGTFAWAVHNDATLHQPGLPVLIAAGLLAAALAVGARVARPVPDAGLRPAE
jgi:MFS transporter, DHA1 family, tetracycline resistance protein